MTEHAESIGRDPAPSQVDTDALNQIRHLERELADARAALKRVQATVARLDPLVEVINGLVDERLAEFCACDLESEVRDLVDGMVSEVVDDALGHAVDQAVDTALDAALDAAADTVASRVRGALQAAIDAL